jgi:hypothetical protein
VPPVRANLRMAGSSVGRTAMAVADPALVGCAMVMIDLSQGRGCSP